MIAKRKCNEVSRYIRIPDEIEGIDEFVEKKKNEDLNLAINSQIDSTNDVDNRKKYRSIKHEKNTKTFENNKIKTTKTTLIAEIDYLVANAIAKQLDQKLTNFVSEIDDVNLKIKLIEMTQNKISSEFETIELEVSVKSKQFKWSTLTQTLKCMVTQNNYCIDYWNIIAKHFIL